MLFDEDLELGLDAAGFGCRARYGRDMKLTTAEARARLQQARIARLATAGADGQPHLVPITFVLDNECMYFAIDHKPKSTMKLRRLQNITENPQVSVLVDHYSDDWDALWWARADGTAEIWDAGDPRADAVELLSAKYEQYRETPPLGPVVAIAVRLFSGWSYAS
ncbi:TIGR03668 family PPOX class F420-dependent oxidoreductase [Streptacidiphilus sp. N1-12]|uniref:TIGR03668 family PPOX class F420-dependent oxidoreductase n=2 Tax=Streptacidiphilus alkalitolerans TaxID=3342712 RepID=A0ABV6V890_9ACTN